MSVRIQANRSTVFRDNISCRHFDLGINESQEHRENCQGTQNARRGLDMDTFTGKVI